MPQFSMTWSMSLSPRPLLASTLRMQLDALRCGPEASIAEARDAIDVRRRPNEPYSSSAGARGSHSTIVGPRHQRRGLPIGFPDV